VNLLKEKLRRGERLIGTHVSLVDPCVCEIFGYLGFDYIWVDMEHTYIDCLQLYSHIMAGKAERVPIIVRIPQHNYDILKRVLEMGVDGIVFPMERNYQEAYDDVMHSVYPPEGVRGFGPRRAVRYGMDSVDEYLRSTSYDVCRFIQIEHAKAIACLDDIMEIPHIDGFIFGPCDLAGSLGEYEDYLGEKTSASIHEATKRLKGQGRYCGVSIGDYSANSVKYWHEMGMDMISTGGDTAFLLDGAKEAFAQLAKYHRDANG